MLWSSRSDVRPLTPPPSRERILKGLELLPDMMVCESPNHPGCLALWHKYLEAASLRE